MTDNKTKTEKYSCVGCANKRTPICTVCKTVVHFDGSISRPSHYIPLGECDISEISSGNGDIKDDIVRLIAERCKTGRAIPTAFVLLYNEIVSLGGNNGE